MAPGKIPNPSLSSPLHGSPFRFFKVILPRNLSEKKLRTPPLFVRKFGHELSDEATLVVANESTWQVSLKRDGRDVWFDDGWYGFAKHYSISAGYFLVFDYVRDSRFRVLIFDMTACEINYPNKHGGSGVCESEDYNVEPESKRGKKEELLETIESDDDASYLYASLQKMGICIARKSRAFAKESKRAMEIARSLKLKKPSFMVIVQTNDLNSRNVYVPSSFANKYLRTAGAVKLKVSDDVREQSFHTYWKANAGKVITNGWTEVFKTTNLVEGDICLFELINRKDALMKLTIFHA